MPPQSVVLIDVRIIKINSKKLRKLSQAKINRYIYDYEKGDFFPPIVVEDCGGFYTVRDGRHRYQAQLSLGYSEIFAVIYNRFEAVNFNRLPSLNQATYVRCVCCRNNDFKSKKVLARGYI